MSTVPQNEVPPQTGWRQRWQRWQARRAQRAKHVRSPNIMQMEAVECGAASLAMILAYYGKFVPLEELRAACGVSRDGSKASNVLKAARKYGLIARGLKAEPVALRAVPCPFVVFWNFNHFLVVDGMDDEGVQLNDPALGRRRVCLEEFDQSFTGVLLAFEPGPEFVRSGQAPSLLAALKRRLVDTRSALVFLILVGLALVLPGLIIPTFTAIFIDTILVGGLQSWVLPLIAGMLATCAVQGSLLWLQRHFLLKLETRIALATSARFFWHTLRLPIGFYQQRSAGDIGVRVGINNRVANVLSVDLVSGVLSILTAAFFALVMMFYDVTMSGVTLAVVTVNFFALQYVSRLRKELNQKMAIDQGKVAGISMNGLMSIETLKACGAEGDFFSQWAGYQTRLTNSTQAMRRSSIALELLPQFLTALNLALVLGIGGMRVIHGEMTIGMLVAFQALVLSFVQPVNALVTLSGKIQNFHGDMNRLDDVLNCHVDGVDEPDEAPLVAAKLKGGLELRNVTFGYSPLAPPLLENFSLSLQPGQRIALVGPSGCGKSTISKLVAGLYQPWQGEILFDGVPRSELPKGQFLNSVATVDQEIALFAGTIRDNLTMWDNTIAESVMVRAAKDACIHHIISSRAAGYDTLVTEGGKNFSGGQRQRMEIARALTSNPRLLILDEATAALDSMTEKMVEANVRRRGCSCLVVAHRLSAIRDCDEIVVLEQGKVVERGNHASLLALDGYYARLIANE